MSLPELRFVLHWILHGTVPADGSQRVVTIRQELDKNAGKREREPRFWEIAPYSWEGGSLAISQNVAFNLHVALTALVI